MSVRSGSEDFAAMDELIIVDVDTTFGRVRVISAGLRYSVEVDGVVRHPGCTAEDVMRALGNYLHSAGYKAQQSSAGATAGSGC